MLTINKTVCCLLLVLSSLCVTRTAVLPSTTTKTPASPPPDFVDPYANSKGRCTSHSDCFCNNGVGFCFHGTCTCIWDLKNPEEMTEEEIAALMSQHPTNSSEIDKPGDAETL